MFRHLALLVALGLASCSSPQPAAVVIPGIPVDPASEPASAVNPDLVDAVGLGPPSKSEPQHATRVIRSSLAGIPMTAVTFDIRTHRLAIADQPGGPGSKWPDAASAARDLGGIAAVNGGFFTPEGAPLGLVVTGGKRVSPPNRASSLGAGLFIGGPSPALLRRDAGSSAAEILQSGPFLVENHRAISGLSPETSTARTFIGWDGGTGWIIARTGTCSLASLGQALAGTDIGGVKCKTVLNLDGGRSSDLWVSGSVAGGPVSERPFWNKPVRNFLVLLPRG